MKVIASAPAKAILFGEHSVNRGQSALAVSVGLRVWCEVVSVNASQTINFSSSGHTQEVSHSAVQALAARVDGWRKTQGNEVFQAIRQLAHADFFAPAKYILANVLRDVLPHYRDGLRITWRSEIPSAGGLGSGGASGVALAMALAALATDAAASTQQIGQWAYLGDVIAHGGVASALDTQTSLLGGVIRYTKEAWGQPVPCHEGLSLVIGNTRVRGRTAEVNTGVRNWLAADATRMSYFEAIGALSKAAEGALASGDWALVGKLMNLNQMVLEKIGVSCPELETLNRAALAAGAYGAKLAGSGGGGIMIALTSPQTKQAVAEAIASSGGDPITPDMAVQGARLEQN